MATVSVNMEWYNEDEVGASVWACPISGGGMVVWCGPCLCLRVGVSSYAGGGVVGSAEGRGRGGHSLAHSTDGTVYSTGGACVRVCARARACVCVCVCVHMRNTNATDECRFEDGAHG